MADIATRNILIFTNSADSHACSVSHVIKSLGHASFIINTARFPVGEQLSIDYSSQEPHISIGGFGGKICEVHSTWNRRFSRMYSLPENLHPADHTHVRNSAHGVINGVLCLLDRQFPVNPIAAARLNSSKLIQLDVARAVGFKIPPTLISNSFSEISHFVNAGGEVCVKSYYAQGWKTDNGPVQAITAKLTKSDLTDPESYEVAPHIYQGYINKKFEYRLTMFGNYQSCVKIKSRDLRGEASVDWRASPDYLDTLEFCYLPDDVIKAARRLLSNLGLKFGALDIAETDDGEFIFFEVNESGQWLWQELHCPDCILLQPFGEYLIQGDDNFEWNRSKSCPEFHASAVMEIVANDPIFQSLDDHPDQVIHVADERTAIV